MATKEISLLGGATLDEVAGSNPAVDVDQVTKALSLMDELDGVGFGRPRYDLVSPYGHAVSHQGDEGNRLPS